MATPELQDFLAVLGSGDRQAVEQLLGRLNPFLHKVIHLRLKHGRLRRVMDTTDIFQSLVKDFLSRKEHGHSAKAASGGLCAWLVAAVHYKILTKMRKERRHAGSLPDDWDEVSSEPSPAQEMEDRDLGRAVRARLSAENRLLYDLKAQELTWTEIAQQVGGNADALRMRLSRAIVKILRDMRYEEFYHAP
jgi:RNA polymerase sigma factor (sigma-70 family)